MRLTSGKISRNDIEPFDREEFSGLVYVASEQEAGFNAFEINVDGSHPLKKVEDGIRMYRIEEGSGVFTIDEIEHEAAAGDVFIIKDGGEYKYHGNMKIFEVNIL